MAPKVEAPLRSVTRPLCGAWAVRTGKGLPPLEKGVRLDEVKKLAAHGC